MTLVADRSKVIETNDKINMILYIKFGNKNADVSSDQNSRRNKTIELMIIKVKRLRSCFIHKCFLFCEVVTICCETYTNLRQFVGGETNPSTIVSSERLLESSLC